MKKLIALVLLVIMVAGCTFNTEHGSCIGIQEQENPKYRYQVPAWNVVAAVIFVETLFVPLVVLLSDFKCPMEKVDDGKKN
jgi:predicted small secreted protein